MIFKVPIVSIKESVLNMLNMECLVFENREDYKCSVKPVLRGHLKIDKTKVLMENGSIMKVKSIAECPWSILQYF